MQCKQYHRYRFLISELCIAFVLWGCANFDTTIDEQNADAFTDTGLLCRQATKPSCEKRLAPFSISRKDGKVPAGRPSFPEYKRRIEEAFGVGLVFSYHEHNIPELRAAREELDKRLNSQDLVPDLSKLEYNIVVMPDREIRVAADLAISNIDSSPGNQYNHINIADDNPVLNWGTVDIAISPSPVVIKTTDATAIASNKIAEKLAEWREKFVNVDGLFHGRPEEYPTLFESFICPLNLPLGYTDQDMQAWKRTFPKDQLRSPVFN